MDGSTMSPEAIVASLSVLLVSTTIILTATVFFNDEGIRKCLACVKNLFFFGWRKSPKKEKRKKQRSRSPAAPPLPPSQSKTDDSSTVHWEELFKVTDHPVDVDSSSCIASRKGSCMKCKVYSAKRNCRLSACGKCCHGDPTSVCPAHGTGYTAASNELDNALQYGYIEVDISYSNLRTCPPQLSSLGVYVVTLNLSNNRLSFIPEEIGLLIGLKELFLQYNHLSSLPESICSLVNLLELDVKNNAISSLPANIGNLRQLNVLCAMNNLLTHLPSSIGNLVYLEELSLHSNALQFLPEELCRIRSLKLLYCAENKLIHLPKDIGRLVALEEMDLSYNQLVSLPDSLCRCQQLTRLWLTNNKLETLPSQIGLLSSLKELHIRRNSLKYFPLSITELPLYTFSAQHNPIIKEQQIEKVNHTPRQPFPPLLELAARSVVSEGITFSSGDIPVNLEDMLSRGGVSCSRCGRKVFYYYSCNVVFKLVGVYYRLPLYEILCSPYNHNQQCV